MTARKTPVAKSAHHAAGRKARKSLPTIGDNSQPDPQAVNDFIAGLMSGDDDGLGGDSLDD